MTLEAASVSVRYEQLEAVRSTTLTLEPGELVALIGPNGAGKTSLLRALGGIRSTTGSVRWRNSSLDSMSAAARARTVAYLPQSPEAGWPLAVRELVELGRLPHRRFGQKPTDADRTAVVQAMRRTGVTDLAERPMNTLSGGERMRVHLARAFAVDAPVLLVDEPVASLDPYHQLSVMQILREHSAAGRLVVAVMHDLTLASGHCSRMLLMDRGRIALDGSPRAVLTEETLAAHYRIAAYLADHDDRRVAVPWKMLD
jgi:iron complex transport system ATP-binding protein